MICSRTGGMSKIEVLAVVPLRLKSERVPEKILKDISGQALCIRTLNRALAAFADDPSVKVIAAVDSAKTQAFIQKKLPSVEVLLTDPALPSGTDRVFAATGLYLQKHPQLSQSLKGILNIQGDMPFAGIDGLQAIADFYKSQDNATFKKYPMSTLAEPWSLSVKDYQEAAAVKVISNREGGAIYFSRFPIPHSRIPLKPKSTPLGMLHVGVYGFTLEALTRFCATAPTDIERTEGLEQLRALWLGMNIFVIRTQTKAKESFRGVDTPKDLLWAKQFLNRKKKKGSKKK